MSKFEKIFDQTKKEVIVDQKKVPWVLTVITMGVKLAKAPRVQQLALVELGTAVYLSRCAFVIDWEFEQAAHVES